MTCVLNVIWFINTSTFKTIFSNRCDVILLGLMYIQFLFVLLFSVLEYFPIGDLPTEIRFAQSKLINLNWDEPTQVWSADTGSAAEAKSGLLTADADGWYFRWRCLTKHSSFNSSGNMPRDFGSRNVLPCSTCSSKST